MSLIDNTLAAQVPTFDPATPLAQAAKLQAVEQETRAAQFKQAQLEIGSEARGLQPFVNTPEFPAKWAETSDRLLQKGLINPQMHAQWRNAPSPLLLKQMIAQTEDPTLTLNKEKFEQEKKSTAFTQSIQQQQLALAKRASDRADEGEADAADDRAKAAVKYGLLPGTPEYKSYVLGGGVTATGPNKIDEEVAARDRQLKARGMDPTTPQNQQYALTGKYPREDAQPLTAGDKKIITTAEDEIPTLQGTISALKSAKGLNDKTFTGATAGLRGKIGTSGVPGANLILDKDTAMATSEFGKLMSGEAIKTMSETLKGATTDFEMKKFETMLADPSTPPEIRGRTIDRMITLAERQLEMKEKRVAELRGGTYFKPNSGKAISKEDYEKLPKGSKYTAPDGSERTKQ